MKTIVQHLDPNQQVCVRAPRMSRMIAVRTLLRYGLGQSTVENGCVWVSLPVFRSLAEPQAESLVAAYLEDYASKA